MFDLTAHDEHPPLYYGVLHYWVRLAGNSETSLRAPSAVFGAATILLVAIVAWRVGGWLLGVIVSLLLLLNAPFLSATQEARMYPLMTLLAVAASIALAGFVTKPSVARFAAYAALAVALIYTNYSGFIVIGAQGLVFALYGVEHLVRRRNAWIIVAGSILLAVLFLAYIPWWSTFRAHADVGVQHIANPSLALVKNASRSLLGLDEARGGWLVLALPLILLGGYGLLKRWRDPRVVSLGVTALVPVGQILVSVWYKPVFDVRYAAPFIPGLALIGALGYVEAAALARHWRRFASVGYTTILLAGVSMATLMGIALARTYRGPPVQDWRAVAAESRGSAVILAPGYQSDSLDYYRGSSIAVTPLYTAVLQKILNGLMPVPKADAETMLILQGGSGHAVLGVFQAHYAVERLHEYAGWITTYRLRPQKASE